MAIQEDRHQGEATVVRNAGSHFMLSRLPEWVHFPAVLRGRTRLTRGSATNPVAVGDRVRYSMDRQADESEPAIITEILPWKNYLIRRATNLSRQAHVIAANLDQVLIAVSLYFPEIKLPFLDRILVTCEVYGIRPVILLNKVDMYREFVPEEIENFLKIYRSAGYRVIETSAVTGEGIDELRQVCASALSLFTGESGVGKSSLIKAIDPTLNPKIAPISQSHLQGRHTTSLYEMYRIHTASIGSAGQEPQEKGSAEGPGERETTENGGMGYVIDAPGLRGFGLVDVEREEIYRYFPEMLRVADNCRFVPCTHTHEPDCAVKAAVDTGEISPERYNSYLGLLEKDKKFR